MQKRSVWKLAYRYMGDVNLIMRFFNTAGPCRSNMHYCLPPLERFDLDEILSLIEQGKYFILHAPRQTGKTTCLIELMHYLNSTGQYTCLYFNVEVAQGMRENISEAMEAILREMILDSEFYLKDSKFKKIAEEILETKQTKMLSEAFSRWATESELPLILLIDEIDSLIGDTLITILRELRAGYNRRPAAFPQSIVLCGLRDIRDYRIHSSREKAIITGGSAFNIKAASLRLGDFSKDEIKSLYDIHTKETGQKFNDDVIDTVWEYTEGQPWLVNALGYEVCFEMKENRDRNISISREMILRAKENIILRRDTHIDQLVDKLKEERVHRVIEPILLGVDNFRLPNTDDLAYVEDLGLIKRKGNIRIANRMYMEAIPRELIYATQYTMSQETEWYVDENGLINMNKLLKAFQKFFRKNSEFWLECFDYKEAGPQLLLQAFLQRIVNSGGRVEREYGLGRRRTDILVTWQHEKGVQECVIELKIKYGTLEKTIKKGLEQTAAYMDKCGTSFGHLVIFDRDKNKTWDEKIFCRKEAYGKYSISIWGM